MNLDTLRGALRSKTIWANTAALGLFGVAPTLLQDTALMQSVIGFLPPNWQAIALVAMPIVNAVLRARTTQSLESKAPAVRPWNEQF